MSKFNKTYFILLSLIVFSLIGFSGVSAIDCPSEWTFIDKPSYNICFHPNVTDTGELNITDNNNNTLLSYIKEFSASVSGGTKSYYVNFSDLQEVNGINYIDYHGSIVNSSTQGTYYFLNNSIIISLERRVYQNWSSTERIQFYNYGVKSYNKTGNTTLINSYSGTGTVDFQRLYQVVTNMSNYTLMGVGKYIHINKSSEVFYNFNGLNQSHKTAINSTANYPSSASYSIQFRKENITEFQISQQVVNFDYNDSYWYFGDVFIIYFNNSDPALNLDEPIASSGAFSTNLFGGLLGYDYLSLSCSTSGYFSSCMPWQTRKSNYQNIYLQTFYGKSDFLEDILTATNIHLKRLYSNLSDVDTNLVINYNYLVPLNNSFSENRFNNTHTRLIADTLMALSERKDNNDLILNNISNDILIRFLENKVIINPLNSSLSTISHSSNSQHYFSDNFVFNTHSSGVSSLISAINIGLNVNSTLLSRFIQTIYYSKDYLFNESLGNVSYYSLGCNVSTNNYSLSAINCLKYNSFTYIYPELSDLKIIYMFNKSETFRDMSNRQKSQITSSWNGTTLNNSYSSVTTWNTSDLISIADYINLSDSSFSRTSFNYEISDSFTSSALGMRYIPKNVQFRPVFTPIFLSSRNTTFFINTEDKLLFETPKYAMISDFKYDNQGQKGMKIYIKWAYNVTNGNFTNLSRSPYQYFYSPQQQRFINYTELINLTATSDKTTWWIGNLSDSTFFTLQEGYGTNFSVDSENLGLENSSLWFSSSSSTSKHIASNLSQTINATVLFNVDNCDEIANIEYVSDTGTYTKTYTNSEYTCSDGVVTLIVNGIEPATNSNVITINTDFQDQELAPYCRTLTRGFGSFGDMFVMIILGMVVTFVFVAVQRQDLVTNLILTGSIVLVTGGTILIFGAIIIGNLC